MTSLFLIRNSRKIDFWLLKTFSDFEKMSPWNNFLILDQCISMKTVILLMNSTKKSYQRKAKDVEKCEKSIANIWHLKAKCRIRHPGSTANIQSFCIKVETLKQDQSQRQRVNRILIFNYTFKFILVSLLLTCIKNKWTTNDKRKKRFREFGWAKLRLNNCAQIISEFPLPFWFWKPSFDAF